MDGKKVPITSTTPPLKLLADDNYGYGKTLYAMELAGEFVVKQSFSAIKLCDKNGEVITSIAISPVKLAKLGSLDLDEVSDVSAMLHVAVQAVAKHLSVSVDSLEEGYTYSKGKADEPVSLGAILENAIANVGKAKTANSVVQGAMSDAAQWGGDYAKDDSYSPALTMFGKAPAPKPAQQPISSVQLSTNTYPVIDPKKEAPTVPLREAVGLYRRVKGSSSGSCYFLVADFDKLKLAVRYQSGNLSMRFEGDGLPKHKDFLADLGFNTSNQNHVSAHAPMPNNLAVHQTVGSLIFAVSTRLKLVSPIPDVNKVPGVAA